MRVIGILIWIVVAFCFFIILKLFLPIWLALILSFMIFFICFLFNARESTVGLVRMVMRAYFEEIQADRTEAEIIERVICRRYKLSQRNRNEVRNRFIAMATDSDTPKDRLYKLIIVMFAFECKIDDPLISMKIMKTIEQQYRKIRPEIRILFEQ